MQHVEEGGGAVSQVYIIQPVDDWFCHNYSYLFCQVGKVFLYVFRRNVLSGKTWNNV